MELKPECIRSVMLEIEKSHKYYLDNSGFVTTEALTMESICKTLPDVAKEDIYYTLMNLEEAGYIDLYTKWAGGSVYVCHINRMTYAGHEFLEDIRDSKRWEIVKKGLSVVRNFSLDAISAVAKGATKALIDEYVKSIGL